MERIKIRIVIILLLSIFSGYLLFSQIKSDELSIQNTFKIIDKSIPIFYKTVNEISADILFKKKIVDCSLEDLSFVINVVNDGEKDIVLDSQPFLTVVNGGREIEKNIFSIDECFQSIRKEIVMNFIFIRNKKNNSYFKVPNFHLNVCCGIQNWNSVYPIGIALEKKGVFEERFRFSSKQFINKYLVEGEYEVLIVQGYKYKKILKNKELYQKKDKSMDIKIFPINEFSPKDLSLVSNSSDRCIFFKFNFKYSKNELTVTI